jgi:hypothetical protein
MGAYARSEAQRDEEKWDEVAKLWTALKDTSDRAGRQDR